MRIFLLIFFSILSMTAGSQTWLWASATSGGYGEGTAINTDAAGEEPEADDKTE